MVYVKKKHKITLIYQKPLFFFVPKHLDKKPKTTKTL